MNMEKPVIVERRSLLDDVCRGILQKKYYSILGPRQIGKTTFLKNIMRKIEQAAGEHFRCIYIDLGDIKTADAKIFYSGLATGISPGLNTTEKEKIDSKESFDDFFKALLNSGPQTILLLLDEIEHVPEYIARELLELFRTYHQARKREPLFERLSVIISGSTNLRELTMSEENSPFNIAEPILLPELDNDEGRGLIDKLMSRKHAQIEPSARQKILAETNGHPYLIAKLCELAAEIAGGKIIGDKILNDAIDQLIAKYKHNEFFTFIIRKVENDPHLFETMVEILDKGFAQKKELRITIGRHELSGAFLEDKNIFKIRNNILKKIFTGYFDNVRRGDIFVMLGEWKKGLECYQKETHADRMKRRRQDTVTFTRKRRVDIINVIANMMFLPQKSTDTIYGYLLDGIYYALSYSSVYLYAVNKRESCLIRKYFRGSSAGQKKIKIEKNSQALEVRAYNTRKYIVEDQNEQNNYAVAFPLQLDHSVDWVLSINNYQSDFNIKPYDCDELKTFTNEAVLAIRNAATYYDLYRKNQTILDALGEEISIIDKEYNILYMNNVKIRDIGKDYSGTGEKCYKIFARKEDPCPDCPCIEAIEKGKIIPNNNYFEDFTQTASPLKDENGSCSKAVNIVRDVRKQKRLLDIIKKLQKEMDINKLLTIIMDGIVELGYKRVRFYDYVKKDQSEFVIGRVSRGMDECRIKFRGYRINLKDADYINATLEDKRPKFYVGNIGDEELKNCHWLKDLQLENVKWIDLPLVSSHELIGYISIDNKSEGKEFTNEDLNNMAILASYAAQAIVNSSYISRQKKLYDISKKLSGTLEIGELQKEIVQTICKVLQTEMCSIFLYDKNKNLLVEKSNYALTKDGWTHNIDIMETYGLGAFIEGRVYRDGTSRLIYDIQNFPGKKNSKYIKQQEMILKSGKVKNAVFAPVTYKEDKLGIIRAANKLDENSELYEIGFKQEDLDFLVSLGEQIAIALANSNLYEEKSLQIKGIKALNRVISKITAAANLNEIYKAAQGITKIIPNIHEMCLLKKKEDDYEMVFGCSNKDVSDCENCKKQGRECIKKDVGYSPYYCLDIEEDQYFKCTQRKDLKSRFVIPLVFEKELLAILDIGSKIRDAFSDFEQYLLSSLGSQIAIAINNHINQKKQVEIFKDISHTLGTYLTSVRGYTQLLVEEKVTDEASKGEYLKMLMGDVLTFINSVDEISSLTNIEKWDTASISSKIEIMDIIENLAAKNKFLLEEKQLKLTIPRLDDEKIYIKGDKQKLEEALQSLMNNAIKFSDEKKNIVIHVRIENDIVVIDISDQGYGIHKDDLGKIFEKYERGKEAKYRKIPGTGIGLALTKSIIERHSGTIGVESELGKGSTFTIKLPIYKEDAK